MDNIYISKRCMRKNEKLSPLRRRACNVMQQNNMDDTNAIESTTPRGASDDAVTVETGRQVEQEEPMTIEQVDGEDVEDDDSFCCCTRWCSLCLPSCCMRWPHR